MSTLNDIFTPCDAENALFVLECVKPSDRYLTWKLDYLVSFNDYADCPNEQSLHDIAAYIIENADCLGNSTVREILEDIWTVEEFLNNYDYDEIQLPNYEGTHTGGAWLDILYDKDIPTLETVVDYTTTENGICILNEMTKEDLHDILG